MPLYDFKCGEGHQFEKMVPLRDFEAEVLCSCGAPAHRLISTPMFTVDSVGYNCPISGRWIGSKAAHRDNLDRQGCRVLETGEHEEKAAFRKAKDDDLENRLDATIEKTIEAMPSAKKETLYNELVNGQLDLSVART